jgi:hypothetical protein
MPAETSSCSRRNLFLSLPLLLLAALPTLADAPAAWTIATRRLNERRTLLNRSATRRLNERRTLLSSFV